MTLLKFTEHSRQFKQQHNLMIKEQAKGSAMPIQFIAYCQ